MPKAMVEASKWENMRGTLMKYKVFPYGRAMMNIGFLVYGILTGLFILGAIIIPGGRVELLIMSGVGIVGIGALLFGAQGIYGWVYIDSFGVRKKSAFGYDKSLSWKDCVDIGIVRYDIGSWGIHHWVVWIYFSKDKLSLDQTLNIRRIEFKDNTLIMLVYKEEVLNEVLKYIEKEEISNIGN